MGASCGLYVLQGIISMILNQRLILESSGEIFQNRIFDSILYLKNKLIPKSNLAHLFLKKFLRRSTRQVINLEQCYLEVRLGL